MLLDRGPAYAASHHSFLVVLSMRFGPPPARDLDCAGSADYRQAQDRCRRQTGPEDPV